MTSKKVKRCQCKEGRDNMNKLCKTCNGSGLLMETTTVEVEPYNPNWFRSEVERPIKVKTKIPKWEENNNEL